ncbi:MAG: S8 family serine peptidase [Gaiellaceae bacterium]
MRRKLIPLLVVALILPAATLQVASATPTTRVLVHFDQNTSAATQKALIERVGGRKTSTIPRLGTAVVSVPLEKKEAVLSALERLPGVEYAETDGLVHADAVVVNDPYLNSSSWPLANPHFPDAWSLTTGSSNITVAVIDTGVQLDHPDLGTLVPGHDFVNNDEDPSDDEGHGTAVAGIIAAQGNNGQGVAGTCWQCRIMPVKVLDVAGLGQDSWIASGIIWAVDHGADVINLSLGGPDSSQTLADSVSYAQDRGVVVVASAGNDSSSVPEYPAAYPGVISVGGVDASDNHYDFSDYGSWVQVDAPGCTNTTHLGSVFRPESLYYVHFDFCGTSAAAPFVAGLAGLARSYNPAASALSVANAIEQSAHPLASGQGNSLHGLIDASAALQAIALAPPGPHASFTPSVTVGVEPLRVTFTNNSTNATSYVWTFGDGATSTETSPVHTFVDFGTFNVILIATRSSGERTTASATITVNPLVPTASFKVDRISGSVPLTVTFMNSSLHAASYLWSFGDQTPFSIEESPQHTFTSPGTYEVTLVATGEGGSATAQRDVIVTSKATSKATSKPDLKVSLARTASRHDGPRHVDSLVATLSNRGLAADTQVKLRITLPVASGVKSVSAGGGSCTLAGRRITCSFGTLAAKKTVRTRLVVSLPSGARTTASASGGRAEVSLANNSASIRSS